MKKNIFLDIKKYKNRIALYTKNLEVIKYSHILKDSEIFGKFFQTKKTIIILAENSYEFIVSYVSALKNNQLLILVSPNTDLNGLKILDKNYSPEYIVCNKKKYFQKINNKIFDFKNFSFFQNLKKKKYTINKNLSCLLSTSGTTGDAKFAKISIENLMVNSKGI